MSFNNIVSFTARAFSNPGSAITTLTNALLPPAQMHAIVHTLNSIKQGCSDLIQGIKSVPAFAFCAKVITVNPTLYATNLIKGAPKPNLKQIIYAPPKENNFALRLIEEIVLGLLQSPTSRSLLVGPLSRLIVPPPELPPMKEEMLGVKDVHVKKRKKIWEEKREKLTGSRGAGVDSPQKKKGLFKTLTSTLSTEFRKINLEKQRKALKKEETQLELEKGRARADSTQERKPLFFEKLLYKLVISLLNPISKKTNISNIINIVFIELKNVLTAVQEFNFVNSDDTKIKRDFVERLTKNINLGADGFEIFKKNNIKKIRKNLDKILSNIDISVPHGIALAGIRTGINNGPLTSVLQSVIKTISDELCDQLFNVISPEQVKGWVDWGKDGINFGPYNLSIALDDATYQSLSNDKKIECNIHAMAEIIVFTLIDVVIDAVANYTDWSSDQRSTADQNRMPPDLQKNFEGLIDAIRSTLQAVSWSSMPQNSAAKFVNRSRVDDSLNNDIISPLITTLLHTLVGATPSGVAKPLFWWALKKTQVEKVVSEFATYLQAAAKT
jgi:hypothetical protein